MIKNLLTRLAFAHLKRQIQKDSGYAWSWQCNLAMAFYDHLPRDQKDRHEVANRGAALFLSRAFDANVTKQSAWQGFKKQWAAK